MHARQRVVCFLAILLAVPLQGCFRSGATITNEKLAGNKEYVALSRELAEAKAITLKLSQANTRPLTQEQVKEFEAAAAKSAVAANRMKEIEFELVPESRWHAQAGWKAADYFQDPQVVALCQAIENNEIDEMERLIGAGADVNAIGKDGMTPLLWAFPDRKVGRFACLLRHGANPNVFITGDFDLGSRAFHAYPAGGSSFLDRGCHAGQSIMHLASRSPMIDYLRLVVAHGGDVNQVDKGTGVVPLDLVLDRMIPDAKERVALLMARNVDLNRYCAYRRQFPTMAAVVSSRYDLALVMLEGGADPHLYQPDGERKLIHIVLAEQRNLQYLLPQKVADYHTLVDWLAQQGELLDQARADEVRWAVMHKNAMGPSDHARIRQQIIDERSAKQAADKAASRKP